MKCSIALAAVTVVGALPAAASADYDLTVRGDAPTAGVTTTTAQGVATFQATAPGAVLSTGDISAAIQAGNALVVESGDGTGATGSLTVAPGAAFFALDADVTLRTKGALDLAGRFSAAKLTLDAGGAITQTPGTGALDDLSVDEGIDVSAGGPVMLQGTNVVGALRVHTTSDAPVVVHATELMALVDSSVGGPLTILADDGIDLAGTIRTGGTTVLVADDDAPAWPRTGTGNIMAEYGTVLDAGGHPAQLYSAKRDLSNLAPDLTINGARYTPGAAWITTSTEAWGRRWRADTPPPTATPFQFVFEEGDTVAPTVSMNLPDGARYTLGQVIHVTASCADTGGSGLVSCVTTGLLPGDFVNTAVYGEHFVTVLATDGTGNQFAITRHYQVFPPPRPPRVCVRPTTATVKLARPKGVKAVVATLSRVGQKIRLTRTQIVITVNVTGRPVGKYPMKVVIRRRAGMKAVTRRPKVVVYRCQGR